MIILDGQVFRNFTVDPTTLDIDQDLWDCLGRVKVVLKQNFMGPI